MSNQLGSFFGSSGISGEVMGIGGLNDRHFFWGGGPRENGLIGEGNPRFGGWTALGADAGGEGAGGFDLLDIVHQLEGLHRGVAAFPNGAGLFAGGGVEVCHKRCWGGAFEKRVNASAIEGGT